MNKKVLFTATVVKKHIIEFHLPYLKWFKEQGFETYVAAKNDYSQGEKCLIPYCDHFINISFSRYPLSFSNIKSYFQLKKLIDSEHFDLIHCNTPSVGVLTRLAARNTRKYGTKVIYTAHGFHFYKGASIFSWIKYYPIELYCSCLTDVLITINNEDYAIANNNFHAKKTCLVHGVGMSFNNRPSMLNQEFLKSVGCNKEDYIICTVAELNPGKNQLLIMKAMLNPLLYNNSHIKYLLIGDGKEESHYIDFICKHHLSEKVKLLGYRTDIYNILKNSDLFVFPSLREGLPVSLMEAMYCGLPCIICNVRGCRDLIENNFGGYVCNNVPDEFAYAINTLIHDHKKGYDFGQYNQNRVKPYLLDSVRNEYINIYSSVLK